MIAYLRTDIMRLQAAVEDLRGIVVDMTADISLLQQHEAQKIADEQKFLGHDNVV